MKTKELEKICRKKQKELNVKFGRGEEAVWINGYLNGIKDTEEKIINHLKEVDE